MRKEQKIDLISSIVLLVLSCIIILFPLFKIDNLKFVFLLFFIACIIVNLVKYFINLQEKKYTYLFMSAISLGSSLAIGLFTLEKKVLLITFLIWIALSCLVKLKKADIYHDKRNKAWIFHLFVLFLTLTSGLLVSLNLYQDLRTDTLLIGFFFFLYSSFEIIDPIVCYLMEKEK